MYIIFCVIYVIDNNLENFGKQGNSENKKIIINFPPIVYIHKLCNLIMCS